MTIPTLYIKKQKQLFWLNEVLNSSHFNNTHSPHPHPQTLTNEEGCASWHAKYKFT